MTAYMQSARPSICLSVTWVDHSKTVEVRIMQLSPQSSPIPLVFAVYIIQKFWWVPPQRGHQTRVGWGNKRFSSFMLRYVETVWDV